MLFNSFEFLFVFFPLCIFLYFGINSLGKGKLSKIILVFFSLYFYAFFNISYLPIILSSIIFNYWIGLNMRRVGKPIGRKLWLVLGVIFNLGLLGYFKYVDFFIANINALFGSSLAFQNIILPLGISFFTFQQLAYVIDNYKQRVHVPSFLDYCNFVTFFPQLIAGPIVLPEEMLPQFENPRNQHIQYRNLFNGLFIFSIGLAKKVIIADSIAVFVNAGYMGYASHFTMAEAWLISLSYSMQLYFDFSGYCDMAIGIGKMFNIDLPINFNNPYISQNFQEFWKRWHITLNRFLSHYLYYPLGGSRNGTARTYLNIMVVFLASGIWHGAGWTFILWGVLHGVGVVVCRFWRKMPIVHSFMPRFVSIAITFFFVNILWVLFRSENLNQAWVIISSMFNNTDLTISPTYRNSIYNIFPNIVTFSLLAFSIIIAFTCPTSYQLMKIKGWYITKSIFTILFIVLSVFLLNRVSTFLYFNF